MDNTTKIYAGGIELITIGIFLLALQDKMKLGMNLNEAAEQVSIEMEKEYELSMRSLARMDQLYDDGKI